MRLGINIRYQAMHGRKGITELQPQLSCRFRTDNSFSRGGKSFACRQLQPFTLTANALKAENILFGSHKTIALVIIAKA